MKVKESKKGENVLEVHFAKYEIKLFKEMMGKRKLSMVQCFQLLIKKAFVWYFDLGSKP